MLNVDRTLDLILVLDLYTMNHAVSIVVIIYDICNNANIVTRNFNSSFIYYMLTEVYCIEF